MITNTIVMIFKFPKQTPSLNEPFKFLPMVGRFREALLYVEGHKQTCLRPDKLKASAYRWSPWIQLRHQYNVPLSDSVKES